MDKILGFLSPWIIYTVITLLHYSLPTHWRNGYVRHSGTGEILKYRLNGMMVLVIAIVLWFCLGYLGWVPYDWLYTMRWYSLAGACVIGILFSLAIVMPFPSTGRPWFVDLFLGRLDNPQTKNERIDVKIWLYLIGAVMLELHVLSFIAHHYILFGEISPGIFLCGAMLSFFVWDYLTFENVHLYTYDFFAERVGIKLGWGCLTFYPYFYAIVLWSTVHLPGRAIPTWLLICFALVFISGWMLARGANLQKYYFKTRPGKSFLGITPKTISDGNHTLLVNGFWGVSRHVNYLGEILMALGIALCVGYPGIFWVWLYPLYYIALLLPRQMDDDKRCAAKYGDLWNIYTKKVKYRIIPYLY